MSAQPADAAPARITLPRTIRAVRGALTPEQREQFNAELEDVNAAGLRATLEKWWLMGVLNLAGSWDRIAQVEAGTARTIPIEDVIPNFAELHERRHGVPYLAGRTGR